jgi:hypothetical protein
MADNNSDQTPSVRWEDEGMTTAYANVANATSSREEVILLFGVNQAWHGGQDSVDINLSDRIVLSPFAAKRLHLMLTGSLKSFDERFGGGDAVGGNAAEERITAPAPVVSPEPSEEASDE